MTFLNIAMVEDTEELGKGSPLLNEKLPSPGRKDGSRPHTTTSLSA